MTRRACQFLEGWQTNREPFFLFVGHLAPHFPLVVPEEIYEKYKGRVPAPEIPEGLIENLPRNYQQLRYGFGVDDTDPELVRHGRDLYWALVDWYDRQVGQVLEALEKSGHAENTIVIYTSDHGEKQGRPRDVVEE